MIEECEYAWAINTTQNTLKIDAYIAPGQDWGEIELKAVLDILMDEAYAREILVENSVVYRDLFDTELMGRLTPRPGQVIERFWRLYREDPQKATAWYYKFSQDTNYIRRDWIAKDVQWKALTEYGEWILQSICPNRKRIIAARNLSASNYPRCAPYPWSGRRFTASSRRFC